MNIGLDEGSVRILKGIFNSSDLDHDGKVSRLDLKASLALDTEQDSDRLFRSLKSLAGGDTEDEFLTFEEYCKGIMEFPDILKNYKQDFCGDFECQKNAEVFERVVSEPGQRDYLANRLKNCIGFYNESVRACLSVQDSFSIEDLLSELRGCIEKLKNKNIDKGLIQGNLEVLNMFRDFYRFHGEVVSNLNSDLNELKRGFDCSEIQLKEMKLQNESLLIHIDSLETAQAQTEKINNDVNTENLNLKIKLEDAENEANNSTMYIKYIETKILSTQKEVDKLEKELRDLNSLNNLKDLKSRLNKYFDKTEYSSERDSFKDSEENTKTPDSKPEFRFKMLSDQLKKKNKELSQKNEEVEQLKIICKNYQRELEIIKQDFNKVFQKYKDLLFELDYKKSEEPEAALSTNLHDELVLMNQSFGSQNDCVVHDIYKASCLFKEASTQTKKNYTKPRSCCAWF